MRSSEQRRSEWKALKPRYERGCGWAFTKHINRPMKAAILISCERISARPLRSQPSSELRGHASVTVQAGL